MLRRLLALPSAVLLLAAPAAAAQPGGPVVQRERPATAVIVAYDPGTTASERLDARRDADVRHDEALPLPLTEVVRPERGTSVAEAVRDLRAEPDVRYAEPDAPRRALRTPDDTLFGGQWALRNTGQTVGGTAGTAGADIDAEGAWDLTTGGPVLVAVVDTGTDLGHPDLVPNLWQNPGEAGAKAGNGADDDGNGIIDDLRGADFVADGAQPYDENGHGTHVAGTIGASGDDGRGVTGVAWRAQVATVRVLDGEGSGTASDLVEGYRYAARIGARVVNASLGGGTASRAEREAIAAASDVLFVVAAGNEGADNDRVGSFPCNYDLPNIVCVGATDQRDELPSFSNTGARTVDLAAPGTNIGSTWPGGDWVLLDGTSMATPHVAGAAVLALARDPSLTVAELRRLLLATAEPVPALAGRTVTGGRLDAAALVAAAAPPPPREAPAPPAEDGGGTTTTPASPRPEPTAPTPSAPALGPEPSRPAAARDTRAPGLAVVAQRRVRRARLAARGLAVRARCSEGCRVRVQLRARGRTARATARRSSAGTLTLRVRPGRRVRAGRARLRVTATDASGNARTRTSTVVVTR